MLESLAVNFERVANELNLPVDQVKAVFELLGTQHTVSFIARYRKEQTKGLSEEEVARVEAAFKKQVRLAGQKFSFTETIKKQGKLTPELEQKIQAAGTSARVEDLYLPFRSKRGGEAQEARVNGLEPLADLIQNAADETQSLEELAAPIASQTGVSVEDALKGATAILAERYAESFELRRALRDLIRRAGKVVTKKIEKNVENETPVEETSVETENVVNETVDATEETNVETVAEVPTEDASVEVENAAEVADDKKQKKNQRKTRQENFEAQFAEYFDATIPFQRCAGSRVLAINRAEKAEIISVEVLVDQAEAFAIAKKTLLATARPFQAFLEACLKKGVDEYALPSLKADERALQSERAQEQGALDYAKNLRNLFMQRPMRGRRVIAVEPGARNGSCVVALDEKGALVEYETVFFKGSEESVKFAETRVVEMIEKNDVKAIVIGKDGKSREAERFVQQLLEEKLAGKGVAYVMMNSVGVNAYAQSLLAQTELPELEPSIRAAVSLGRRLQDPLAELLKVGGENLSAFGVRPSESSSKKYRDAVKDELSLCVNRVGVDLNSAPNYVLERVSGITALAAQTLVDYRTANGPFQTREQLRELKGVGELAFKLSSGFLRVKGGPNALDETGIHPESYELANKLLAKFEASADDLRDAEKLVALQGKVADASADALAAEFEADAYTVAYILEQFAKFGQDPRDEKPFPIFKSNALKLEDVQVGAEMTGTVERLADFGAFVDVGLPCLGLVHISQLSVKHINSASECVAVGDVLKVWVIDVDAKKRRVSLTALPPGVEREPRRGRFAKNRDRNADDNNRRSRAPRQQRDGAKQEDGNAPKRENRERRNERSERPARDRRERREAREDRAPRSVSVAPKKKNFTPITENQKSGKEPLRSFGDLLQYFGGASNDEANE